METRHASNDEEWLAPGEAAALVGVTIETLRRWAAAGLVPYRQIERGRHRRFKRADLIAAMEKDRTAEQAS